MSSFGAAEKNGTYVNTEGRRCWGARRFCRPEMRVKLDEGAIPGAGRPLPFDNLSELRAAMVEAVLILAGRSDQSRALAGIASMRGGRLRDAPSTLCWLTRMTCSISRARRPWRPVPGELGTGCARPQAAE